MRNAHAAVLNLSSHLLQFIPRHPSPYFLQIAILSNNSITDFSSLSVCRNLVEIDLSHNAITSTPPGHFFTSLAELSILRLDNNQVADWRAILPMQASTSLVFLSLHSNPFCQSPKYRAFVVNLIPNLKGLDRFAVSDEELSENVEFSVGYEACSLRYRLPGFVSDRSESAQQLVDDQSQMRYANTVVHAVHNICTTCSPTLRIQGAYQRYKFYKEEKEMLSSAAKVIQRLVSHR